MAGVVGNTGAYGAENSRGYNNSTRDIDKFNNDIYSKSLKNTQNIVKSQLSSYTGMYAQLTKQHSKFLKDKLKADQAYFKQLDKMSGVSNSRSYDTKELDNITNTIVKELGGSVNKMGQDLDGAVTKAEADSASFLDGLKQVGENFIEELERSLSKYLSAYESTFTNIASRTSSSYSETRQYYKDARNIVAQNRMSDVVDISEDMIPAMSQNVNAGFTGDKLITKSFNDSITKYIMPWLDSTSEWFNYLTFNLSDSQMSTLKGMQLQLQATEAGNRLVQSGVVNTLQQEMSPMLATLTISSSDELQSQILSITEQLMETTGMTEEAAKAQATSMVKAELNPYSTITSGSIGDKLYINAVNSGQDRYSAYNSSYGKGVGLVQNASNSYAKGAIANAWGLDSIYGSEYLVDAAGTKTVSDTGVVNASTAEDAYNATVETANETKTITQKLQTIIDNSVVKIGEIASAIPNVLGILGIIGAVFKAGGIKKLLSSFFNTSGETTALSGASGILGKVKGLFSSGSLSTTIGPLLKECFGKLVGFVKNFMKSGNWVVILIGIILGKDGFEKVFSSVTDGILGMFENLISVLNDDSMTTGEKVSNIIGNVLGTALGILATLGQGLINGVKRLFSSVDELIAGDITVSEIFMEEFGDVGSAFLEGLGEGLGDSYKVDSSNEGGLSYVPYDGYVAELHEGERVLTKEENKAYTDTITTNIASGDSTELATVIQNVASAIIDAINANGSGTKYGVMKTSYDENIQTMQADSLVRHAGGVRLLSES